MGNSPPQQINPNKNQNMAEPLITTMDRPQIPPEKDYYKDLDKEEYMNDIEKISKDVIHFFSPLDNQLRSNLITVRDIKEAMKNYQTFFNGLADKDKFIYLSEMSRFIYHTYIKQESILTGWTDPHIQGIKKYALYIAMQKFVYENS
jgi:hypothetical protein